MSDLTRQELCVALRISESTVRRLEADGMPSRFHACARRKAYSLPEIVQWLAKKNPEVLANRPPTGRNFYSGNARAKLLKRTPPWADRKAIREFYVEATRLTKASGVTHHVDHIIPLQGELVSGLHVPNNLQVLPALLNRRKRNHFEIDA